jgi:ribonuclease HI
LIDVSKSWGLFDGACQGNLGSCGPGATLYLHNHHYFSLEFGVGLGTHKRVEFFALWILAKFVVEKKHSSFAGIGGLQVVDGLGK